jgi:pimeloyl-ACP methyl ester carboxylesterase
VSAVIVIRFIVALVVSLVVVVTAASFIYNAVTSDENVPVRQLWKGKFVEADGVLTAYREWGTSGPPIVLVGGFLEPTFVWQDIGPRLAGAGHRVYALDLDGFGYSQRRGPSTLQEWADQVEAFSRALGISKPEVVGHSLGAAVAVEVARRGFASRAVLLDGDALRTGGPPRLAGKVLAHTPLLTSAIRLLSGWDWAVKRMLKSAYGPNRPPLDATEINRWTDPFRAKDARQGLERVARNGIAGFSRSDLKRMKIKALVVWGADDSVDDVAAGRTSARDLRAQFVEIPGAGHLSMLARPGLVASAIAP